MEFYHCGIPQSNCQSELISISKFINVLPTGPNELISWQVFPWVGILYGSDPLLPLMVSQCLLRALQLPLRFQVTTSLSLSSSFLVLLVKGGAWQWYKVKVLGGHEGDKAVVVVVWVGVAEVIKRDGRVGNAGRATAKQGRRRFQRNRCKQTQSCLSPRTQVSWSILWD